MSLLLLLGGAVVGGLLAPLAWQAVALTVGIVLLVRPLAGTAALAGTRLPLGERAAVGFFGIRGVGSIYSLAWALNHPGAAPPRRAPPPQERPRLTRLGRMGISCL